MDGDVSQAKSDDPRPTLPEVPSTVPSAALPAITGAVRGGRDVIPGGVTSSVRAGALPHPLYVERGAGAELWDADGHRYVDFVLGYGPLLLGHAPDAIREALACAGGTGHHIRLPAPGRDRAGSAAGPDHPRCRARGAHDYRQRGGRGRAAPRPWRHRAANDAEVRRPLSRLAGWGLREHRVLAATGRGPPKQPAVVARHGRHLARRAR